MEELNEEELRGTEGGACRGVGSGTVVSNRINNGDVSLLTGEGVFEFVIETLNTVGKPSIRYNLRLTINQKSDIYYAGVKIGRWSWIGHEIRIRINPDKARQYGIVTMDASWKWAYTTHRSSGSTNFDYKKNSGTSKMTFRLF